MMEYLKALVLGAAAGVVSALVLAFMTVMFGSPTPPVLALVGMSFLGACSGSAGAFAVYQWLGPDD